MSKCARWSRTSRATKLLRATFAWCCLRQAFARPISRRRSPRTADAAADRNQQTRMLAALMMQRPRRAVWRAAAVARSNRSLRRWLPRVAGARAMPDRAYNVLFLCTGNSARSIIAEAILNRIASGKFNAYSAGSQPKGQVNPQTLQLLKSLGYETSNYWSKSWSVFAQPTAQDLDFVFTVCDNAAGETCPVWPGQPMTAHWGIPDPAEATGTDAEIALAFKDAYRMLHQRIAAFTSLPIRSLDALSLQQRLREIGRLEGATAKATGFA